MVGLVGVRQAEDVRLLYIVVVAQGGIVFSRMCVLALRPRLHRTAPPGQTLHVLAVSLTLMCPRQVLLV